MVEAWGFLRAGRHSQRASAGIGEGNACNREWKRGILVRLYFNGAVFEVVPNISGRKKADKAKDCSNCQDIALF
jgi:hypothetical protein